MKFQKQPLFLFLALLSSAEGFAGQRISFAACRSPSISFTSQANTRQFSIAESSVESGDVSEPSGDGVEAVVEEVVAVDEDVAVDEPVTTEEAATETAAAQKPRSFAKPVEDQTCIAYVVNLSYDTPGYKLREIFGEFGTVQKVFIPKRKDTGKAKGIAFITMSSKEERDLAITKLTGTEVDGRTVYVDEAKPRASEGEKKEVSSKKLYVGNICFTTTKEDLVEFFGEFGFVQDVYIPLDRESQQPRGFAFVKMGPSDADAAIEATNGVDLQGRRIDVKESLPRGIKAPPRAQVTRSEVKLYVGNLSFDTEEERVRDVFEEFGPLIDVYLPVDRYSGNSRGFAFVTVTSEMAQSAIEATDGLELDGRMLRVNEAQPKGFRNTNYDEEEESWGNEGEGEGDGEGEYEE